MQVTIDAAGRVVLPKPVRQALGLSGGQVLDLHYDELGISLTVAPRPTRVVTDGPSTWLEVDGPAQQLSQEELREILDQVRR